LKIAITSGSSINWKRKKRRKKKKEVKIGKMLIGEPPFLDRRFKSLVETLEFRGDSGTRLEHFFFER